MSRSKLKRDYRRYDGLYKEWITHTDQVMPALIRGTHHYRMRKNIKEAVSNWNYIISARELISGDGCLRRLRRINEDEMKGEQ